MSENARTLSWNDASERYRSRVAPAGLRLTQALANSIALETPRDRDPLGDRETAHAWLATLGDEWADEHDALPPQLDLTARGVARLRRLRGTVRDALLHTRLPDLRASVEITTQHGHLTMVPKGTNGDWLESAISAELLLAQENDTLRRLKLCRNPTCQVAFYDRSKNNSKIWHDLATCGLPHNVRAYRARQRTHDSPAPDVRSGHGRQPR
jgi:predicted RNA-binding Zn ribbon-like protein